MSSQKRILITAGGTGGHLFPAQALADELSLKDTGLSIVFVAGGLEANRFFERSSYTYKDVPCGRLTKNPLKLLKSSFLILQGVWHSYRYMRKFRPNLVIGFGSFNTFPTLIAAKLAGVPIILHEANCFPGKLNRLFAPYAKMTAVHFAESAAYLKGNVITTGMPLRKGYKKVNLTKTDALAYYALCEDKTTLLVLGGSQGAKKINECVEEAILNHSITFKESIQIIHLTGKEESIEKMSQSYASHGIKAIVKAFEKRMDMAWRAADFSVTRAGASSIAEQIEYEVPGILIPYPYAAEDHQTKNARQLVEIGAGVIIAEKELTPKRLAEIIGNFISNYKEKSHLLATHKERNNYIDLSTLVTQELG